MSRNTLANNQRSLINPYIYEAEPIDYYSMLSKGFAQQEERREKATKARGDVNKAFATIKQTLHNDPYTNKFIADYERDVMNKINNETNVGNWGEAINVGIEEADKLFNDPRIVYRQQFNKDLTTFQQEVDNDKTLDEQTKEWFSATQGEQAYNTGYLKYEDTYDDYGNVIGGTKYTAKKPLPHANVVALTQLAAQMLPDRYNVTDYTDIRQQTLSSLQSGSAVKGSRNGSTDYRIENHQKLATDINALVEEITKRSGLLDNLNQEYEEFVWKKQQLEQKLIDSENTPAYNDAKTEYDNYLKVNGEATNLHDFIGFKIYSNILSEGMAYNNSNNSYTYRDPATQNLGRGTGSLAATGSYGDYYRALNGPQSQVSSDGTFSFNASSYSVDGIID